MAAAAGSGPGPGPGTGSSAGTGSSNPRKFSEKIALQKQRQAEETAAFEEVMMEICSTRLQAQKLRLAHSRGPFYGGSLPNVNQIGSGVNDFQGSLHSPLDSTRSTRHHGLVERVQRDPRRMVSPLRRYVRQIDSSPYGPTYLSPPPEPGWRRTLPWGNFPMDKGHLFRLPSALNRTNSDSALHTSVMNPAPQDAYLGPAQGAPQPGRRGGFRDGDADSKVFVFQVPPIEESFDDPKHSLKPWDAKKLNSSSARPRSCEVPGIHIFPSPDQPSIPVLPPSLNSGGSLPDLTTLHFPSPLPTPLDPDDGGSFPALGGTGSTGSLASTMTQLGISGAMAVGAAYEGQGLPSPLQSSLHHPPLHPPPLQSSLSNPNLQASLRSPPLHSSLSNPSLPSSHSSSSIPSSLSNPSLSNQSFSNQSLSNQSLSNPSLSNPSLSNQSLSNQSFSNQSLSNPSLSNPSLSNPSLSNQSLSNQSLSNQSLSNQSLSNQSFSNQSLSNQSLSNPSLSNQSLSNQSLSNQSLSTPSLSSSLSTPSLPTSPRSHLPNSPPHPSLPSSSSFSSPRRRVPLSPLTLPMGGDARRQHPKQFSPTMSPTLSSIAQGVPLDTSKLPAEQRLPPYPYNQPGLALPAPQHKVPLQPPPLPPGPTARPHGPHGSAPQRNYAPQFQPDAATLQHPHIGQHGADYGIGGLEPFAVGQCPTSGSAAFHEELAALYPPPQSFDPHPAHRQSPPPNCSRHGAVPNIVLTGDSPPGISKEIAAALSAVPGFEVEASLGLEDELRIEPLSLDGLHMLSDPYALLTDPAVEDSFRTDRLQ